MIKIEKCGIWGFEGAIRGMRNPMNSWDRSDTTYEEFKFPCDNDPDKRCIDCLYYGGSLCMADVFAIGENDLDLMKKLANAGSVHAKYRRMIHVQVDITAPLYWWKEFDTYKVGTVANSCSTMHKIHAKPFELNDFSHEHLQSPNDFDDSVAIAYNYNNSLYPKGILHVTIQILNKCRELYLKTKDKKYWWQMIQLLPSSYNQKRTIDLNYEV